MKKTFILSFLLLFVVLPVFASTTYYVTRSGDILQQYTQMPIFKYTRMDHICNIMLVKVGMDRYYIVKDDGSPYSRKSLLGCQDCASTNIFDPLVVLNTDKILEKVTSEELKNSNIRFVKYKGASGVLDLKHQENDLSLDKIAFIDLNDMVFYSNNYGFLHMYLKPKMKISFPIIQNT